MKKSGKKIEKRGSKIIIKFKPMEFEEFTSFVQDILNFEKKLETEGIKVANNKI